MALQLARDGYSVTVLTSDINAGDMPRREIDGSLTVKRLWAFNFAHIAFIPGLLWQLLRVRKPTVFHLHLAQAYTPEMVWLASKLRGVPYVVHFHLDVQPSGTFGFIFSWWKRWIQPRIIKDATRVITLSPDQTRFVHERYHKPVDQIEFIGNGVGDRFLALGKAKRIFHNPLRLIFVGRLSLQKRPERLVEAMALTTSNVTLDIVGDGEDRKKLEALVTRKKIKNVTFFGRLDGERLLDAYRNADVFVLPSDREGMPLVVLEAMATGLPIVGSDVIGIHELIDGVGILVKDPSPRTFAWAIDAICRDPRQLSALSAKSIEAAKHYSWQTLAKKFEAVYETIAT